MGLPWVRLDTQWPQNQKFLQLVEDKRWRAIAVYMAGLAWAGGQGQDGYKRRSERARIAAEKRWGNRP
jgi:hypothetical protein